MIPRVVAPALLATLLAGSALAQTPPAAPQPPAPPTTAAPGPADSFRPILEDRALALLKETATKLAAAKTMRFTATVGYEYPSRLGPPILYTMRYDVAFQRPDRLRVVTPGDGPASEFGWDGRQMMAWAPAENLLAVADAPNDIEAALKRAFDTAGIYFPFTDLLLPDPYKALTDKAYLAFVIGPSVVVGGVKTEMVAWASNDVFLQIWIGAEDRLPRRIRAIYADDPLRLRHDMELSDWKLDEPAPPVAMSDAAKGGKRIPFAAPSLPPAPKP